MGIEQTWKENVQDARKKARRVIAGNRVYESVETPSSYASWPFVFAVVFLLQKNWKIIVKEESRDYQKKIFSIKHRYPTALEPNIVEDNVLHSLRLLQPA